METVLVTGATGYCGSNLVRRLIRNGVRVHVIARPKSDVSRLSQKEGSPVIHLHDGTIASMMAIVERVCPSAAFHLAATSSAEHKPSDVDSLLTSNVVFSTHLFEALSQKSNAVLVNTGTFWQHFDGEAYDAFSLYAATKQAVEDILGYYVKAGLIRAVTLSLYDTYGPFDFRKKLFRQLRSAAENRTPILMSPGEQMLDFVYIDDVVDAYLCAGSALSKKHLSSGTFSVATFSGRTLREVVSMFEAAIGFRLDVHWGARSYRPREILSPYMGESLPNWNARYSLESGIDHMLSIEPLVRKKDATAI
jgi:nucleoside-diphosphate-sugar epimerase